MPPRTAPTNPADEEIVLPWGRRPRRLRPASHVQLRTAESEPSPLLEALRVYLDALP